MRQTIIRNQIFSKTSFRNAPGRRSLLSFPRAAIALPFLFRDWRDIEHFRRVQFEYIRKDSVFNLNSEAKMYETLLTNEECAHAMDLGNFYRVPCDKRDLNYDKYFTQGSVERNVLTEFNSNNTQLLTVEQVKEKLLALQYIRDELAAWEER